MEFWGVEVKSGETLKVSPGEGYVIHLSQAAIGESKKGNNEVVPVHVKIDEQKLVIGTLSADKFPQITYDVVFDKDFELSHNSKNASVFFCGYKTQNPVHDDDIYSGDDFDSDSEDEALPIENVKPVAVNADKSKPVSDAYNKVKIEDNAKGAIDASNDDSSDEDDLSDSDNEDLSDSDDDESSDEEDEKTLTPKKENNKRPNESATKTPVPSKKANVATPQNTNGKKVVAHTATPHPGKQTPKTTMSGNPKKLASGGKPNSHFKGKYAAK